MRRRDNFDMFFFTAVVVVLFIFFLILMGWGSGKCIVFYTISQLDG